MNRLFVRFGLPWLICGSVVYALYWVVLYGESISTMTPSASFTKQTSNTQETVRPTAIHLTEYRNRVGAGGAVAHKQPPHVAPLQIATRAAKKYVALPQPTLADPLMGLQDVNPNNRIKALAESDAQGLTIPAHTLQQLATSDRDPAVRILAMTKYAQDPLVNPAMVRATVEAGVRDGDPTVSAQARELLEQLEQAARSNEEMPQLLAHEMPVQ